MVAASLGVFHHLVICCSLPARSNDRILLKGFVYAYALCLCLHSAEFMLF